MTKDYKSMTMEAVEKFIGKDYKAALTKFTELSKQNFKNSKIHEILSFLYLKTNNIEMAEKEYNLAVKFASIENPLVRPLPDFNTMVSQIKNPDQLKKDYLKIISLEHVAKISKRFKKDLSIPINLSILYMAQGKYKEAEKTLIEYRDRFYA